MLWFVMPSEDIHFLAKGLSLLGRKWSIQNQGLEADASLCTRILRQRSCSEGAMQDFLAPSFKTFMPDPCTIPSMREAVEHTQQALQQRNKFGILADYDVDGATSAALLYHYLSALQHTPFVIIPHRITEGYGPKKHHIDEALAHHVQTLFMLDCGTAAHDVIAYANTHGVRVIVLDHHTPTDHSTIPDLCVNPMLRDTPLNTLCAAGVTFMFLVALQRALRTTHPTLPDLHTFLDLVALGTICDVVPLVGLNRVFVQRGLALLQSSRFPGVQALVHATSASTEEDVGFRIGPALNAGSRMGQRDTAARLLMTQNAQEAHNLCQALMTHNQERKNLLQTCMHEAHTLAKATKERAHIVLHHPTWSPGLLGLIAARISEHHNKPTWVITTSAQPAKGAARCPLASVNLAHGVHKACAHNVLSTGGGHKAAAGFTIDSQNIAQFADFVEEHLPYTPQPSFLTIDGPLPSTNLPLIHNLLHPLRPFGHHNSAPCFVAPYVTNITPTKSGPRHSMFVASYKGQPLRLVRFAEKHCPVRCHLENVQQAHIAGFLNVSGEFSSFLVCDALPANA